jgi:hypothetical protein
VKINASDASARTPTFKVELIAHELPHQDDRISKTFALFVGTATTGWRFDVQCLHERRIRSGKLSWAGVVTNATESNGSTSTGWSQASAHVATHLTCVRSQPTAAA